MDKDVLYALIVLTLIGTTLMIFHHANGDSLKVERFYYKRNQVIYRLMQFTLFFLLLNAAIYIRVIIMYFLDIAHSHMQEYAKKRGLKL